MFALQVKSPGFGPVMCLIIMSVLLACMSTQCSYTGAVESEEDVGLGSGGTSL